MTYAPPLPTGPPPVLPPVKRPWWKATWALITAGALVGIVIGSAGAKQEPKTVNVAGPTTTATVAGPTTTATVAGPTTTATAIVTTTPTKVIATHVRTVTVTYTPPVKVAFSDGTFRVGTEIRAGTYHTKPGPDGCYYERDNRGNGLDAIIANDIISGPTTIDIAPNDYAFKSSGGCDWVRIS